jgi:hypothetical protein
MHKNATKCNKTQNKWCINKHGASKIIDTFETYHHSMVCGSWQPSDIAPLPIKCLRRENPKSFSVFPDKVLERRHHRRPIWGDRSLCSGTLPGWGSAPEAISINSIDSTTISIDSIAISIDIDVSHDEEGVVLPRG